MIPKDYRILLIDDEPDIVEILSYNLEQSGYKVYIAQNGKEGIEKAMKYQPHLIIVDMMMPGIDGVETCEQIRTNDSLKNTIIAFLTARSEDYSQIAGFRAGADDYMIKPVSIKVFLARIGALLRRNVALNITNLQEEKVRITKHGNLEIDMDRYTVILDGEEIFLPKKEFNLLVLLSSKPGNVFTREKIFSSVWGDNVVVTGRTIDVHIRRLRNKIGNHRILTIKGVGYKYKE
jgi:two-component system alkaline phosphatase synthesis response regulator PhoP